MTNTVEVTLPNSIDRKIAGDTIRITKLTVSEPTYGQVKAAQKAGNLTESLIENCVVAEGDDTFRLLPEIQAVLPISSFREIEAAIAGFLEPPAGSTES